MSGAPPEVAALGERIPPGGSDDPDEILERFLDWVADIGFTLYPAQEEALLELAAGNHVVLGTPTGSGKSLVALFLHFKGLCEGRASTYTSPIKALASEKFFALCEELGAERVGMMTGDASINPDGLVRCCTAEVLANQALRHGERLEMPYVVMDEFHYYSDRDRGWAWQAPLITLPSTQFLLMSATLGDTRAIAERVAARSGRPVRQVLSGERPVPLEFAYRETSLHETIEALAAADRAPIYVVNFTQRECAELAQSLTSMQLTDREEKAAIREAIAGARFDTPYGRELRRFLGFGVGVHHAGLLPKYRLLVEQLAQRGLLKVISGTDTLGVGVNIPIRTVLFTKLAKFDGRRVTQLKVREFQQIAGRAGRRGFDEQGWVVCQAPEEAVEKKREERKGGRPRKRRKNPRRAGPGAVSWSEKTFAKLTESPPEALRSRFRITSGMVLDLLARDAEENDPQSGNFASIRSLVRDCHEDDASKARLLRRAAEIVRSLGRAGIVRMVRDTETPYLWVVVDSELQVDFSLFHALSLFLVEAIERLERPSPTYQLDVLTLVETVLEDPTIILRRQVDRLKTELLAELKAEGVSYEERVRRLDEVAHPQPLADFVWAAFDRFRARHPWVRAQAVSPKAVAREMVEGYLGFAEYVRRYHLQRSEGVVLRYLSQAYKTLDQNVPDLAKSDQVWDVAGYLRAVLERVDTSLIEEWESLAHPELRLEGVTDRRLAHRHLVVDELLRNPSALAARVRAEAHLLIKALAAEDWQEAARAIRQGSEGSESHWPPERFAEALAPFLEEHGRVVFDHRARLADKTTISRVSDTRWTVVQVLCDPEEENLWCLEARVDLGDPEALDGPILELARIGT